MAYANGSATVEPRRSLTSLGLAQFKDELRRVKQDAVEDLSKKMDELIEKADFSTTSSALMKSYTGGGSSQYHRQHHNHNHHHHANHRQHKKLSGELPEKAFMMQNSMLTDLFQSKHIQTIENLVVAALMIWALVTAVSDYFDKGSVVVILPSLALIERQFFNYPVAAICWIKMMFLTFAIYPIAHFWANNRPPTRLGQPNFADRIFCAFYLSYQVNFLLLPYNILFANPILGPAAAIALALEQVRLIMKMHAFVREVTKRITRQEECLAKKDDGDSSSILDDSAMSSIAADSPASPSKSPPTNFPGFSRYLYFLFAPTLIYRDVYPRTESTNWSYVCSNFLQIFGCIIYVYYIMERYLETEFKSYSPHNVSFQTMMKSIFRCILPSCVLWLMGFFGFLHSWLNAWAEMLRFGDRLFYKDWWNCCSFAEFFRTWNCVVYDWLYTYVYKDTQELLVRSKFFAALMVFTCSALFHEYIIIAMLKFFFPVLLVEFGVVGFLLIFISQPSRISNVLIWAAMIYGMGQTVSLYAFEVSARSVCPPTHEGILDWVIPRFWTCMQTNNNNNYTLLN